MAKKKATLCHLGVHRLLNLDAVHRSLHRDVVERNSRVLESNHLDELFEPEVFTPLMVTTFRREGLRTWRDLYYINCLDVVGLQGWGDSSTYKLERILRFHWNQNGRYGPPPKILLGSFLL